MKKFNYLLGATLALASALTMSSCGDDDIDVDDIVDNGFKGTILVNEGKMGDNNASLTLYSKDGKLTAPATLQALGDVANDALLAEDGKIYVALTNSKALVIADIKAPGFNTVSLPESPRHMAEYGRWIYISCKGGNVLKYDKETSSVITIPLEGAYNLEDVAILNDTLYVCNSYTIDQQNNYIYMDELLSLDLKNHVQGPTKKTFVNPNYLTVMNGRLFVLGFGNYANIPYQLGEVNIKTGETTFITNATKMSNDMDRLLYSYSETNWTDYSTVTSFGAVDLLSGELDTNPLPNIPDKLKTSSIYFMKTNPKNGEKLIGVTDYVTTSTIYHVGQDGDLIRKFDSKGMNTNNALFIN